MGATIPNTGSGSPQKTPGALTAAIDVMQVAESSWWAQVPEHSQNFCTVPSRQILFLVKEQKEE